MRKLVHLQVLRAVAATLVVADHATYNLDFHGIDVHRYLVSSQLAGVCGVCAFFMLSGLIMTLQMADHFGEPQGPFRFFYRRIIRIVPMYWIATLSWYAYQHFSRSDLVFRHQQLILSLSFIPNYLAQGHGGMQPIVIQGWTLNYEMFFYLLFAFALFMRKSWGLAFLILLPEVLVAFGEMHRFPAPPALGAVAGFYCDIFLGYFAQGVLMGWVYLSLANRPHIRLPFSPALALAGPYLAMLLFPGASWHSVAWNSVSTLCAVVIAFCLFTTQDHPRWCDRTLLLLGDASYSTYLFHFFAFLLLDALFARWYGHAASMSRWAVAGIAAAVIAAHLLGLAIHLTIERPLTQRLRFMQVRWPFALVVQAPAIEK